MDDLVMMMEKPLCYILQEFRKRLALNWQLAIGTVHWD